MKKIILSIIFLLFFCGPLAAQYACEWTSNDLGQYGWGGSFGYDIDGDGILTPLNTDADGSGELIVTGFYIFGSTYYRSNHYGKVKSACRVITD